MASLFQRIVGFNTVDIPIGSTNFSLYDMDIAIRDLLNTFKTPKGSRVMLPNFGSNIYSYQFENYNDAMRDDIINDAISVVNSDPRFYLSSIDVETYENGITIAMTLLYQPQNMTVSLSVNFDNETQGIT